MRTTNYTAKPTSLGRCGRREQRKHKHFRGGEPDVGQGKSIKMLQLLLMKKFTFRVARRFNEGHDTAAWREFYFVTVPDTQPF